MQLNFTKLLLMFYELSYRRTFILFKDTCKNQPLFIHVNKTLDHVIFGLLKTSL